MNFNLRKSVVAGRPIAHQIGHVINTVICLRESDCDEVATTIKSPESISADYFPFMSTT